jgi:hypothetical protein
MCSYLLEVPDPDCAVTELELTLTDVNVWLNLLTGTKQGQADVSPDALRIVNMDHYGTAEKGYLSTWGQTGCTVILAFQEVGRQGCWAYFNHVRSSSIDVGIQHACHAVSQLLSLDNIVFVMMGGPGGKSTYKSLLQRIRPLGHSWRFIVLVKPESRMEESVLCIESCTLALTADLVDKARNDRKQLSGFHPQRVPDDPPKPTPRITGHRYLDDAIKDSTTRVEMWISLSVEAGQPPEGMPPMDKYPEGVQWIMNPSNLKTLLTALSKQSMYEGLDVHTAAGRLLKHIGLLPFG